jgi:hypothetical protein
LALSALGGVHVSVEGRAAASLAVALKFPCVTDSHILAIAFRVVNWAFFFRRWWYAA